MPMREYPPQRGMLRVDVEVCCRDCGLDRGFRDVPTVAVVRAQLLNEEGWTTSGRAQNERWRCGCCSQARAARLATRGA